MRDQEQIRARIDAGTASSSCWRAFRRFCVFLVMVFVLVEWGGVPGLRWTYQTQGERVVVAEYLGPMGSKRVSASELGGTCPLIALIPLERSLMSYVTASVSSGSERE